MRRLLLLPALVSLFSMPSIAAVGDIATTTITFSEVEAIQDCTQPNSITTFTVGDFTFEFTPAKEDGESLCYKDFGSDYGKAIYFWLGDYKKNGSKYTATSGDALKITNEKGHYIKKVTVNCLDISTLNYAFFTTGYDSDGVNTLTDKENDQAESNIFYHQSMAGPHETQYVGITSMEITTEETEEIEEPTPPTPPTPPVIDEDEFALALDDITFEEKGAGKSLMNFKLTVYNPGNVSKYHMLVCDPDDASNVYYSGTFDGNSFPNADQPQSAPVREATTATINGLVPLNNLRTDDDTPIAISITPLYETYKHAETPSVPKSTSTGASESVAHDNESRVQFYNMNGTQATHPVPGTPYIRRQGGTTSKIIIR